MRNGRRWAKLCSKARGKFVKLADQGWPKYTKPKRSRKRWQWKEPKE